MATAMTPSLNPSRRLAPRSSSITLRCCILTDGLFLLNLLDNKRILSCFLVSKSKNVPFQAILRITNCSSSSHQSACKAVFQLSVLVYSSATRSPDPADSSVLVLMEFDIPMHATAERLVLRLTAATEGIVLSRGSLRTLFILALLIFERDATGNAVRPIFGDGDRRFAHLVDLLATLNAINRIAQRTGWTVLHGGDDLLPVRPVWIYPRILCE